MSFVSQQENSVNRVEEQRLELSYSLGVSAMALVQVRNVECLILDRNNEEDKTEQNENQTKPQNPNTQQLWDVSWVEPLVFVFTQKLRFK